MTMFKLVTVAGNGKVRESEFHGYYAEVSAYSCFNQDKGNVMVWMTCLFEAHTKDTNGDPVWYPRSSHFNEVVRS